MFSYYKTLVIFSVLYNLSVQLILYIIICTSTPVLSLLLFLSPPVTINLFSVSVNLSLYYYIHQLVVFFRFYIYVMGFPGSSSGKESTCNTGDPGLIPGLGRSPEGGIGYPRQYSCLENPHGQRSLASYSPWGRKELDTSEQLSIVQCML